MSPKQRLVTTVWCAITMIVTMILSHGHLIMREIMLHWPTADSWEGRFENALYTQGGLVFLASIVIGVAVLGAVTWASKWMKTLPARNAPSLNSTNGPKPSGTPR